MVHKPHEDHTHSHSENCGHISFRHGDHTDYLHDGHLHSPHDDHYDECTIPVSDANPVQCLTVTCGCGHRGCSHPTVPHDDHTDYLYEGRLHHPHGDHCDDHGPLPS